MRIAYLTTDEVNMDLAGNLAAACDITVDLWSPRDAEPDGQFDALLYDLDYLPTAHRRAVLVRLLSGPVSHPVVVHSYSLEPDQEAALRARGVAVYRRLGRKLFRILRLAIGPGRVRSEPAPVRAKGPARTRAGRQGLPADGPRRTASGPPVSSYRAGHIRFHPGTIDKGDLPCRVHSPNSSAPSR
ncbi:MAG TPA: hypothetical protein VG013_34525 [Gemmataceae bacterium]|jgi:hypothetical protein|nr:hypothetical protein [Gemmataceae bacterium]